MPLPGRRPRGPRFSAQPFRTSEAELSTVERRTASWNLSYGAPPATHPQPAGCPGSQFENCSFYTEEKPDRVDRGEKTKANTGASRVT